MSHDSIPDQLPTEILLNIFTYLPAKQLVRLRQVCLRWKSVIESVICSHSFWLEHCKRDFQNVYKIARYQSRVGMWWFNIYRSLSLWRHLGLAREIREELALACEIQGIQVLRDGIIGVHQQGKIMYFDIETMEPCKRASINGDYLQYTENEDTIVIKSYQHHLYIILKNFQNPQYKANAAFDDVKLTLLLDKQIYYVNLNNDIYVCTLEDKRYTRHTSRFLKHSDESVMCLSYTDQLNYLTFQRNIYSIVNNSTLLACRLDKKSNVLHQLYKYKFLETVDWRVVLQWMYLLDQKIPKGPLLEIITVRIYGDVVFVGCGWGVLRIYYAPFKNGEFDLFNAKPVKQYNFMERSDCPILTTCPIIKVDTLEGEDGHTIVVAMPKKIVVLHYYHSKEGCRSKGWHPSLE